MGYRKWVDFTKGVIFQILFAFPPDLLADLLKDKPVIESGCDNIIVVDNAPKVGPDRMEKLQLVLTKVFKRFGDIVSQDYPIDKDGLFKG